MIDLIKKLLEKIGLVLFGLVCVAIALFSILLGLGSVAEIVIDIVKAAGGGSLARGIIMTPFFIFGAVQIIRGVFATIQADVEKMSAANESLWHYLYIPATIVGIVAVILVLYRGIALWVN